MCKRTINKFGQPELRMPNPDPTDAIGGIIVNQVPDDGDGVIMQIAVYNDDNRLAGYGNLNQSQVRGLHDFLGDFI